MSFEVKLLPPENLDESKAMLRKLVSANRYLAELKGVAATIPNQAILINTLALQEAKDSSAIENIITTHDELFKAELFADLLDTPAAKEVSRYVDALKHGFELVRRNKVLTLNQILEIHKRLERNDAGIRCLSGTVLLNQATGETVFVPPQEYETIVRLLDNLVEYINRPDWRAVDPLVRMAVIHHQFETIHPFYDGNGRAGRIINLLYLVLQGLLDIPILYLNRLVDGGFLVKEKIWRTNYYVNMPLFDLLKDASSLSSASPFIITARSAQIQTT